MADLREAKAASEHQEQERERWRKILVASHQEETALGWSGLNSLIVTTDVNMHQERLEKIMTEQPDCDKDLRILTKLTEDIAHALRDLEESVHHEQTKTTESENCKK